MTTPDPHTTATKRLTATPNCGTSGTGKYVASPAITTVWVESDRLWLKTQHPIDNEEAANREGWGRFTRAEWERLRDCVDKYFGAFDDDA